MTCFPNKGILTLLLSFLCVKFYNKCVRHKQPLAGKYGRMTHWQSITNCNHLEREPFDSDGTTNTLIVEKIFLYLYYARIGWLR